MGFFDLSIPYHESDRNVTDKSSLKSRRLKLALKAMELGYTGVAYNRTFKGVLSEYDRCAIPLFPLASFLKLAPSSSYLSAAVKFHRELLNVSVSTPFRQYTRLTLVVDNAAPVLKTSNGILKSYDIVAVRPLNQNAFDQACKTSEVDIIAIDFSEKLHFRLKQQMVKAAIKRGIYFEITYSSFITDAQARREMICNCKLLVDWTRGNNLIFSSAAPSVAELRGPYDVANLFSLIGLSKERAKAAISKNCGSILTNALRKKHFYKEAIKVEKMPSNGQSTSEQSPFDEWLKWDPISSGDGDLLLDDIEKSFSTSSCVAKTVKTIDFMSSMNGLPVHGLQIRDVISLNKLAPEPPDYDQCLPVEKETEAAIADLMPVENGDANPLPKGQEQEQAQEQGSPNDTVKKQGKLNHLPEESQIPLEGDQNIYQVLNCEDSKMLLDPFPKEQDELIPLPEDRQIPLDDVKNKNQLFGSEDSEMSELPTETGTSNCLTGVEELDTICVEKLGSSSKLDGDPVCNDEELQNCLPSCRTDVLPDLSALNTEITIFSDKPDSLNDICFSANIEESNMESKYDVVLNAPDGIIVNTDQNKIERENEKGPLLASLDLSSENCRVEREKLKETIDTSVSLGDEVAIEDSIDPMVNENSVTKYAPLADELMSEEKQLYPVTSHRLLGKSQAGRGRAKRRATYRSFSFPFKVLLNPKPFKRKARKSKSISTM